MKTNQMMEVSIGGFTLPIGHKTQNDKILG